LDVPQFMAGPAALGPHMVALGTGLIIALTVVFLGASLAVLAASRLPIGAALFRRPPRRKIEDWRWVAQLVDLTDLVELQQFAVERLTGLLRARGGAILLADPSGATFTVTHSTIEGDLVGNRTALEARAPLPVLVAKRRAPVQRAQLGIGSRGVAAVIGDLDVLHAALVIPLIVRGRLLGLIAFGPSEAKEGYADEAIGQAMREAEVIAAVIENVQVHNLALQAKFRADALLEQLTLGVLAADHSGTIVTCNRAARRILALGRSPEGRPAEAFGPALGALLGPAERAGGKGAAHEMVLDVQGRGEVPVRIRAAAVGGPLDAPGRLLLIEDLSERRALESELRRARQLASLGTLAAEMAHEIRNPLVSIKTYSQLLPERLSDRDFQLTFARVAQREVDAISRIIDRLLDFAGPSDSVREPTELERLADEVIELLSPDLEANRIAVETAFAPHAPSVVVNRDQIRQVLRNIVANAIQAMPSGGRVRMTTSTRRERGGSMPGAYVVEIEDTGCGIPKEKIAKVFDPFFTTRERGFGLGLSLARHAMEEHGGSIEIESEPGRGTKVTLVFPLVHAVKNVNHSELRA